LRYELNELVDSARGIRAVGTGRLADLETSLVVRAIGCTPRPLRDAPWGTGRMVSDGGHVLEGAGGRPLDLLYARGAAFLTWSGWQKRDQYELGDPRSEVRTSPAEAIETQAEAPAWAG